MPNASPAGITCRIAPPHPLLGNYRALDEGRHLQARYFASLVGNDPRLRGRVLDVGCGANFPRFEDIRNVISQVPAQLDGIDPLPGIAEHPGLTERWCGEFETTELPPETWDVIFTFWVAEHVRDGRAFFRQAHRVLKPGGVLYAMTPHSLHPFAIAVRLVELLRLKTLFQRRSERSINPYPAYYRINRVGTVMRAAAEAGFSEAEFHYLPTTQWQMYFPRAIRFLPRVYDRLFGCRLQRASQVIAYRVEKPALPQTSR
jgi:SAM-dependent methyltransferase